MVETLISVLIFAMFMGLFLLGFYIYTKIVEKKIKKELNEKTEEVIYLTIKFCYLPINMGAFRHFFGIFYIAKWQNNVIIKSDTFDIVF